MPWPAQPSIRIWSSWVSLTFPCYVVGQRYEQHSQCFLSATGSMDACLMVWNFKPQARAYRFLGHKVRMSWGLSISGMKMFAWRMESEKVTYWWLSAGMSIKLDIECGCVFKADCNLIECCSAIKMRNQVGQIWISTKSRSISSSQWAFQQNTPNQRFSPWNIW